MSACLRLQDGLDLRSVLPQQEYAVCVLQASSWCTWNPCLGELLAVGGLTMYLLDAPCLDLDFTGLGLGHLADCPGLAGTVRTALRDAAAGAYDDGSTCDLAEIK